MSTMDAMPTVEITIVTAASWGHPAVALLTMLMFRVFLMATIGLRKLGLRMARS